MLSKKFTPTLVFFLIVIVVFFALQIINVLTKEPLPDSSQEQLRMLDPKLDQTILEGLKDE